MFDSGPFASQQATCFMFLIPLVGLALLSSYFFYYKKWLVRFFNKQTINLIWLAVLSLFSTIATIGFFLISLNFLITLLLVPVFQYFIATIFGLNSKWRLSNVQKLKWSLKNGLLVLLIIVGWISFALVLPIVAFCFKLAISLIINMI